MTDARTEFRRRVAAKDARYAARWNLPGPGEGEATPGGSWLRIPDPPPVSFAPTKPRAVVTVAVGDEGRALLAASGGHLRRYAAECDADFVVIDWPGPPGWPMGAKLGLCRVLDLGYEQVAYLDADTLARPGAVDLFDLCPPDEFGICDEMPWHRRQPQHKLEVGFARFRRVMGFPDGPAAWYGNAGVMVFGPAHRELLTPPAELWVEDAGLGRHCAEQHLWNARLQAGGVPVKHLPRSANWQSWTCSDMLRAAPKDAILHWSGAGHDRAKRVAAVTAAAAANPWPPPPFVLPAHLFADPKHPHYADARHVEMLYAELASGRYGRALEVGCYHGYSTTAMLAAYRAGAISEVHLCDTTVRPELLRVIAHYGGDRPGSRVHVNEKRSVDLLAGYTSFDFAFIDGDHAEETVREELRLLVAAGVRTIALHDTAPAAGTKYGVAPGPRLARGYLEAHGYACREDAEERPGERTERGLLIATRGLTPPPVGARLSVVVATTGRPTLGRTLASITAQMVPGDELIVEYDRTGDMAATPRTRGMHAASGDYVLFMDDDDTYEPGAFDLIRAAVRKDPGRVHLFRLTSGAGWGLGKDPVVRRGNVSTQMVVVPRDPAKFGRWGPRRSGDYDFIASTLEHYPEGPIWHPEVIATWRPG